MFTYIRFLTKSYSKINFRLYGFNYIWDVYTKSDGYPTKKLKILLTVHDCESKFFIQNNIGRKAFRLIVTADGIESEPSPVTIKRNQIFPNAAESEMLNLYMQSHVLQRFKERMDLFEPVMQNFLIQYVFTKNMDVITIGKQNLLACMIIEDIPVGYFSFFIQGNDIVINTFLPIASDITPEGKKLHSLLSLGKEDLIYLGMDKISFYTKVDFEQIPMLKQALIDSNIWQTKQMLEKMLYRDAGESKLLIDPNKTMFVKTFFDKVELHRDVTEI